MSPKSKPKSRSNSHPSIPPDKLEGLKDSIPEILEASTSSNDTPVDSTEQLSPSAGGSPRPPRPSKKSTISELKEGLESLGLDSKGKKETLWRRLIAAFNRTLSLETAPSTSEAQFQTESSFLYSHQFAGTGVRTGSTHPNGDDDGFTPVTPRRKAYAPREYDSFLCFDVEATCEAGKDFAYPNEIIEFPVVLLRWVDKPSTEEKSDLPNERRDVSLTDGVDPVVFEAGVKGRTLVKIDTFHTYVRPTWRPKLSDFCTGLTGITQEMVDASPTFPQVLIKLEAWLDKWDLRDGDRLKKALWVTDGPWDLRDFVPKQLFITPMTPPRYPAYLQGEYLNLKQAVQSVLSEQWRRNQIALARSGKGPIISRDPEILTFSEAKHPKGDKTSFRDFQDLPDGGKEDEETKWGNLTTGRGVRREVGKSAVGPNFYRTIDGQLAALGLGLFEGRQHSGLDDATNISRILIALSEKGVKIESNAKLPPPANSKTFPWMGSKPGEIIYDIPQAEITGSMPGRHGSEIAVETEGKVEAGHGDAGRRSDDGVDGVVEGMAGLTNVKGVSKI